MRKIIQYILRLLSVAVLAKYRPKIVAITGSVGKSSAKEAIFLVLESSRPGRVRRNEANLNTEIGVPLTIIGGRAAQRKIGLWFVNFLKAVRLIFVKDKSYPEILILELAADRPGDIAYLTSFVHPDVAVVTAIGEMPVHLEFFSERDDYIDEKANIIKSLKPRGTAILNYDDLSVRELYCRVPTDRTRIYYGFQEGAEIRISDFSYRVPSSAAEIEEAGMEFKVVYRACDRKLGIQSDLMEDRSVLESADFKIVRTLGLPPLYAVLAGIAVGRAFGISLKDMVEAVSKFRSPRHRLELLAGVKNSIIIDDSYNSSPLAVESALELLSKFKKNRRLAVLGSMRELGVNTESAHRLIGRQAAKVAEVLFLVGGEMILAKEEAEKSRKKSGQDLFWFDDSAAAAKKVEQILQPGDVVLIKGSRSVKMEVVVEEITQAAIV